MQLTHEFTVPASVEETWAAFNDIESVAGCFPGATVTGVEGDSFTGSCKVKLGPIALVYNGSGNFTEKDEAAHVMKIKALGKDKRGNGTAGADVSATMTEVSASETKVEVITDLNITGKPAQFGRGVMQDVSDKLLDQFVECLQSKVGAPAEEDVEPEPVAAESGSADSDHRAPQQAGQQTGQDGPRAGTYRPAPPPRSAAAPSPKKADDALDLGATVLPVLIKSYGKQVAVGVGVVAIVVWLIRRCRCG